jgi:hypothetical protein
LTDIPGGFILHFGEAKKGRLRKLQVDTNKGLERNEEMVGYDLIEGMCEMLMSMFSGNFRGNGYNI